MLSGPISFLLASDNFETTLEEVLTENVTKNVANRERALRRYSQDHADLARAENNLSSSQADNCQPNVGNGD